MMSSADLIAVATYILLSLGGGSAIVWSLSSFLGKLWSQRLLEDHRAVLEQTINEHQIRFSRVFERQAELASDLYSRLYDLHTQIDYLHALTQIDYKKQGEAKCSDFYDSVAETEGFFRRNRIYFSEGLVQKVEVFFGLSRRSAGPFSALHYKIALTADDGSVLDPKTELEKALPILLDAMKQLEAEFRQLLGVKK